MTGSGGLQRNRNWYRAFQGRRCIHCGTRLPRHSGKTGRTTSYEHIIAGSKFPLSYYGAAAHAECNGKRGNAPPTACEMIFALSNVLRAQARVRSPYTKATYQAAIDEAWTYFMNQGERQCPRSRNSR